MNSKYFKRWRSWLTLLVAVGLIAASGYFVTTQTTIFAQNQSAVTTQSSSEATTLTTIAIQPADLAQTAVSAAGKLTLVNERSVALTVDGVVDEITVDVGDTVKAGDLLLKLDKSDLERTGTQAELTVEAAKLTLATLQTPATASAIAVAKANLAEAKENLADVQTGPNADEVAAARSALAAAQAGYTELQAGPSDAALTQLSAALKKAEVTVAEAQRAYDQVAWRNDVGMTSQAADLQSATIDYESAKAAYTEATASANTSELQSGLSNIQNAQATLTALLNSPSAADIATAEAQVTAAEATLTELQTGATANELRSAQITLEQALIELETAYRDLEGATVVAPIDGVVLSLEAEVGVRSAAGAIVATLADPTQLDLAISVAEADIAQVEVGQAAEIQIDALPGQSFTGVVQRITPASDSTSSAVSYPVTIRLTDANLADVLPGMNAVATLANTTVIGPDSWLVPTNGLVEEDDNTSVTVVRGAETLVIPVVPSSIQGEWTIVQSAALQAGDQAVGSVATNTDSSSGFAGGPGGGMPMGGPPQ